MFVLPSQGMDEDKPFDLSVKPINNNNNNITNNITTTNNNNNHHHHHNHSTKLSSSNSSGNASKLTNFGPAPWIDRSLITPPSAILQGTLGAELDIISGNKVDYTNYVKRYANALDCGSELCRDRQYREHFHCLDCYSKVFVKKEEMIRHFKWHKKRDESLRNGFLRFSSLDDCSEKFPNCPHRMKQTHYHCLKPGCRKIYISTSDVSMHASCHRKDAAIIEQGFQRFRAAENCLLPSCTFYGRKTTHFHCIRDSCGYTFKNKADIEKHKTYHSKDEQLCRDGYKKFMKHEACTFDDCRLSRNSNHIHCIRIGCNTVLQSTSQLYSHKKKHERKESELGIKKLQLATDMLRQIKEKESSSMEEGTSEDDLNGCNNNTMNSLSAEIENLTNDIQNNSSSITLENIIGLILDQVYLETYTKFNSDMRCFQSDCSFKYKEHYHCNKCEISVSRDNLQKHAKEHLMEEEATKLLLEESEEGKNCREDCPLFRKETHYHCRMYGCNFVIDMNDTSFKRLDHYKLHEEQQILMASNDPNPESEPSSAASSAPSNASDRPASGLSQPITQTYPTGTTLTSIDGFPIFKRKRGRPPKNKPESISDGYYPSGPRSNLTENSNPPGPHANLPLPLGSLLNLAATVAVACLGRDLFPGAPNFGRPNFGLAPGGRPGGLGALGGTGNGLGEGLIPIPLLPQTKPELEDGFYVFNDGLPCPFESCCFMLRKHFHCSKPRCYFVTDKDDVKSRREHSKDFHDFIDIKEGFAFYDNLVNCCLPGCRYSKISTHFHCIRPGCFYAFQRYHEMSDHEKQHANGNKNNHLNGFSHLRDADNCSPPDRGLDENSR